MRPTINGGSFKWSLPTHVEINHIQNNRKNQIMIPNYRLKDNG